MNREPTTKEGKALCALVDAFAAEMKEKLLLKEAHGWKGWRQKRYRGNFQRRLVDHAMRAFTQDDGRQLVDVANFAAFLWHIDKRPTE